MVLKGEGFYRDAQCRNPAPSKTDALRSNHVFGATNGGDSIAFRFIRRLQRLSQIENFAICNNRRNLRTKRVMQAGVTVTLESTLRSELIVLEQCK